MKKLLLFIVLVQLSALSYGHPTQKFGELKLISTPSAENLRGILCLNSPSTGAFLKKAAPFFTLNENPSQQDWQTYYSNDQVEIQYKYSECDDITNDMYFSYYLIKIINKVDKRIVVRYQIGQQEKNSEQSKNIILEPSNEVMGSCGSNDPNLRIFVNDRNNNSNPEKRPFIISKIESHEI